MSITKRYNELTLRSARIARGIRIASDPDMTAGLSHSKSIVDAWIEEIRITVPRKTPTLSGEVETWYDRTSRNWITQTKNQQGYQQGEATYTGHRIDAAHAHRRHVAEVLG